MRMIEPTGNPYLVYLPDGKMGMIRTKTADSPWAVARVSQGQHGWRIDAVFNVTDRQDSDTVATAERIGEEEARRFSYRRATHMKVPS